MQPPLQPIPWHARPWQISQEHSLPLRCRITEVYDCCRDLHSNWSVVPCNSSVTSGTITNCSPGGDYQKLSPLTMDHDSHLLSSLNSCAVKGLNIALRLSTILKATVVSTGSTGPWRRESRHPWQKENRSPKRFEPHSATIVLLNMHSQEHLQQS